MPCNCNSNVNTPNPCTDSSPCTKGIVNAACVKYDGTLSCGSFGANPTVATVLVGFCTALNNLSACPTWNVMTLKNTAEVFIDATPKYMKDRCGNVQFTGWIVQTGNSGVGGSGMNGNISPGPFTTLPVGLRPSTLSVFPVRGEVISTALGTVHNVTIDIWIDPSGDCYFQFRIVDGSTVLPADDTVEVSFSLPPVKFSIVP